MQVPVGLPAVTEQPKGVAALKRVGEAAGKREARDGDDDRVVRGSAERLGRTESGGLLNLEAREVGDIIVDDSLARQIGGVLVQRLDPAPEGVADLGLKIVNNGKPGTWIKSIGLELEDAGVVVASKEGPTATSRRAMKWISGAYEVIRCGDGGCNVRIRWRRAVLPRYLNNRVCDGCPANPLPHASTAIEVSVGAGIIS